MSYLHAAIKNRGLLYGLVLCFGLASWYLAASRNAVAQQPAAPTETEAGPSSTPPPANALPAAPAAPPIDNSINVWNLAMEGGIFMYPIYGLSLLAITMTVERFLGMRRQRVLPKELLTALGQLGSGSGTFDPRKAYRLCQQYPSVAANIVKAMLVKVGRPLGEVEHTVTQASEREAERLYANVRWIALAASAAPLLGLLGTVQGILIAFHKMTISTGTGNKSIELAGGIYTALVTTFAGLCVAIPATIVAYYFEGRIQTLFHEIDEMVFQLLPQLERYEGRVRFGRQGGEIDETPAAAPPVAAAPVAGKR